METGQAQRQTTGFILHVDAKSRTMNIPMRKELIHLLKNGITSTDGQQRYQRCYRVHTGLRRGRVC